jgi:hypothetical protein
MSALLISRRRRTRQEPIAAPAPYPRSADHRFDVLVRSAAGEFAGASRVGNSSRLAQLLTAAVNCRGSHAVSPNPFNRQEMGYFPESDCVQQSLAVAQRLNRLRWQIGPFVVDGN